MSYESLLRAENAVGTLFRDVAVAFGAGDNKVDYLWQGVIKVELMGA